MKAMIESIGALVSADYSDGRGCRDASSDRDYCVSDLQ